MKIRKKKIYIWLFIIISVPLSFLDLYSQAVLQKPSYQAAIDAYSNGDYEKAFGEFSILLQNYSKDPLYRYYAGVCLVKMKRNPENASTYLLDALNGSLDIRSIPDDAWFYLGRAQQMEGKYADALKSYQNYENKARKKKARDLNISRYIQECNEGRGRIKESDYQQNDILSKTNPDIKEVESKVSGVQAIKQSTPKSVPPKETLPKEYDKVLSEAMKYQVKADSLNALVADYRKEYDKLPASEKQAVKSRISEMESLSAEYQRIADEKFGNTGTQPQAKKVVTATTSLPETNKRMEIFSIFNIETDPERLKDLKISIDQEIPAGLVYRIQMGVFSRQMTPFFFKGISPVSGFKIPGTESTKYFAGLFRRMADASRSLLTVKQMGFKDSFVTAVLDGKAVSLERASIMEDEWGQKPFIVIAPVLKTGEPTTSTLVFRVEVTKSVKPVSDETAEVYRKMAGNRGFEIITAEDGSFVYLIGKFITFESASEFADLLKRNGYRDAKVSAYLGSKEIPVETARQLFEK
jgi:hypothetical protein